MKQSGIFSDFSNCLSRGFLLSFFFTFPGTVRQHTISDRDPHEERLVVVRPFFGLEKVGGGQLELRLSDLLELGFVIFIQGLYQVVLFPVFEISIKHLSNQPDRRIQPSVQIHGGKKRFEPVSQKRRFLPSSGEFLSFSEEKIISEIDTRRDLRKLTLIYDRRTEPGQLAFIEVRKEIEQQMAYRQSENRIAKKLQGLVIRRDVLILVGIGTMDQGTEKKFFVLEPVIEFVLQFFEISCLRHGPVIN